MVDDVFGTVLFIIVPLTAMVGPDHYVINAKKKSHWEVKKG